MALIAFAQAAAIVTVLAWSGAPAATPQRPRPAISTHTFTHPDGVEATYYKAQFGKAGVSDVYVFAYGGSGCVSWRDYMAEYFEGLTGPITLFALNKRHVPDDAGGPCRPTFAADNHPRQWVADSMSFISHQLQEAGVRPRRVVLLGISEGSVVAAKVARSRRDVTDLVIIGDGTWTMRRSLTALMGAEDVEAGWQAIAADVNSLEKTWLGHPHRYWFDVFDLDPTDDYLSLAFPILVGFGEKDESVPLASALALRDAFAHAGKDNLTLRVYQGADHTLVAGKTNYRRHFFKELSRRIAR